MGLVSALVSNVTMIDCGKTEIRSSLSGKYVLLYLQEVLFIVIDIMSKL